MKEVHSPIKKDILLRVRLLYVLFIAVAAVVLLRLIWVQLFSREVAYNADRLSSRIFTEEVIPASGAASWPATASRWPPRLSATRPPSTSAARDSTR